uniref:protein-tyrosine-phosphatase n=1 Tax=Mastacembelus armatus TaxID=205130 RepID=A0A3Q3MN22_9TELE
TGHTVSNVISISLCVRCCFQTAHFYVEDSNSPRVVPNKTITVIPIPDYMEAIPVGQFITHVSELSNNQHGFSEDFEELQRYTADMKMISEHSNHPDTKHKNRYIDIVAYDHSRVKLNPLAGKGSKHIDYISVNYVEVSAFKTQGPLQSTFEDFCQMVLEQNTGIIVMITDLVEKGWRKCDQHWLTESSEEYGNIVVTVKSTKIHACCIFRCFTLHKKVKGNPKPQVQSEKTVLQYHHTHWSDIGVPEYTLPLLTFVRRSFTAQMLDVGSMLVHCSAGVGRTGTYIVINSMLQQIRDKSTINVLGFLKYIHTQHNYLVQTEEQNVLTHGVLTEAILGKETEVMASQLHSYFNIITTPGRSGRTCLEKQLKLVTQCSARFMECIDAQKECNKEKIRDSSELPMEQARVRLAPLPGTKGTDCINASYIMTPNGLTKKQDWNRAWSEKLQKNSTTAVDKFVYQPNEDEAMNCESFTVTLVSEDRLCLSSEEQISIHDFILEATQVTLCMHACVWQFRFAIIFELISIQFQFQFYLYSGAVSAGMLCAFTTLSQQLESESTGDIYQVATMINFMRPGESKDITLVGLQSEELGASGHNITMVSTFDWSDQSEIIESLV